VTDEGRIMMPRNKALTRYSQNLRRNATKEEKHLWYDFLKSCIWQFKRQQVIGYYIVDFYCDKAKLVIELDGAQHYEEGAQIYDQNRTRYFETLGLEVLRFTNRDIRQNFDAVCEIIKEILRKHY
jgi:very-short-patch-repair endonuclease